MRNVTKLVLAAILNGIIFFLILFKNVNVFMFINFEPNFIEKFLWQSGLSKFLSRDFFRETTIRFFFFGRHFETKHFLIVLFAYIYGCFGCIHIQCKFRTEIPTVKYSKMNGSKWTPPLLVYKREWKVA